jgi:hypothetical protein
LSSRRSRSMMNAPLSFVSVKTTRIAPFVELFRG